MIPCFICNKSALGGFTYGLPTTPVSMHVGLCPEHNTLENKQKAILHWIETTQASVSALNEKNTSRHPVPTEYEITIFYLAGGSISLTASKWNVPDQATLQVLKTDGSSTFIPLVHIDRFEVTPVHDQTPFAPASASTEVHAVCDGKISLPATK